MTIITSRRSMITGLISLIAAPAIIRASSLMPVKGYALLPGPLPSPWQFVLHFGDTITFAGETYICRSAGGFSFSGGWPPSGRAIIEKTTPRYFSPSLRL